MLTLLVLWVTVALTGAPTPSEDDPLAALAMSAAQLTLACDSSPAFDAYDSGAVWVGAVCDDVDMAAGWYLRDGVAQYGVSTP